jgi:hypothetical protein
MGAVIPGRSTSIVRLDPPWLTGLSFDEKCRRLSRLSQVLRYRQQRLL